MQAFVEHVDFNGQPPALIGLVCTGLVVQHFYDGHTLADQASVVFLRFDDTWHRIYFETGIVFWRSGQAPAAPVNSTLAHGLLLNDLSEMPGVVGHRLDHIAYCGTARGDVSVRPVFQGGAALSLHYDTGADSTRIDA